MSTLTRAKTRLRIPRSQRILPPALRAALGGADSEAEFSLINHCDHAGLPKPETQLMLVPGRKFRYDACWPSFRVCAEVQGAVYKVAGGKRCPACGDVPSGRHTRGEGYEIDATKSALAQIAGYIVLYVTPKMISSGEATTLIRAALIARGWTP